MKRINFISILHLLGLISLFSCGKGEESSGFVGIIPQPSHIRMDEGQFTIDRNTIIYLDEDEELRNIAGFLNERLRKAGNYELETKPADMRERDGIFFLNAGLPSESYALHIEKTVRSSNMVTERVRSTLSRPYSSSFRKIFSLPKRLGVGSGRYLAAQLKTARDSAIGECTLTAACTISIRISSSDTSILWLSIN